MLNMPGPRALASGLLILALARPGAAAVVDGGTATSAPVPCGTSFQFYVTAGSDVLPLSGSATWTPPSDAVYVMDEAGTGEILRLEVEGVATLAGVEHAVRLQVGSGAGLAATPFKSEASVYTMDATFQVGLGDVTFRNEQPLQFRAESDPPADTPLRAGMLYRTLNPVPLLEAGTGTTVGTIHGYFILQDCLAPSGGGRAGAAGTGTSAALNSFDSLSGGKWSDPFNQLGRPASGNAGAGGGGGISGGGGSGLLADRRGGLGNPGPALPGSLGGGTNLPGGSVGGGGGSTIGGSTGGGGTDPGGGGGDPVNLAPEPPALASAIVGILVAGLLWGRRRACRCCGPRAG